MQNNTEKYPELGERVQATFIDTILVISLMFVLVPYTDRFENLPEWGRIGIFVVLLLLYEPLCMTLGCTLGNFIKGIRVRKYGASHRRINLLQAIVRYPVKLALGWVSFLTIGSSPQRRAIHDMLSGTVMIKL